MRISINKLGHALLLLVYCNLINLVFAFLQWYGIVMVRPLVYFEYLLICFFVAIRARAIIIFVAFVLISLADIVEQLSFIYLFNLSDFIDSLKILFFIQFQYLAVPTFFYLPYYLDL